MTSALPPAAAMTLVLAGSVAAGQTSDYGYYHFKERRPLTLDPSRVAVFANPENSAQREDGSAVGLFENDDAPLAIPGWTLKTVDARQRGATGMEGLVAEAAQSDEFDFVSPVFVGDDGGPVIMTPQILVRFAPAAPHDTVVRALDEAGAGTVSERDYANIRGFYRVRAAGRNGFEVLDAANALARRNDVLFAEPDVIFTGRGAFEPNDPLFSSIWGIHNTGQSGGLSGFDMDGPEAWDVTTGDPSIITVIIDTGVQLDHPDINQLPGTDSTNLGTGTAGGPGNACDNHGTPVAGCVSATIDNALGVTGIAPDAPTASARTFISNIPCTGSWTAQASWTVDSLTFAESIGARVTNNSNGYGFTSSAIATKYQTTRDNGMIHFASAGNDSSSSITYPASLPTVNAVAALNRFGSRASFSNFGFGLAFSAPGQDVLSTDRTGSDGYVSGDYVFINGTSFASPYSAGVAALVLSMNAGYSAVDVEEILQVTCRELGLPGYDTGFGWGMVNAYNAVSASLPPDPVTVEVDGVVKNRFISFAVPDTIATAPTALRVELTGVASPPGNPSGSLVRYVNSIGGSLTCPDAAPDFPDYTCATLGCEPEYRDWTTQLGGDVLHVTGDAVVPGSVYSVSHIAFGCGEASSAESCTMASPSLAVSTAVWGDIVGPGNGPPDDTANVLDIGSVVDKVKGLDTAAPEVRAWLKAQLPAPDTEPVNVLDIGFTVDAVKGLPYPFSIDTCP